MQDLAGKGARQTKYHPNASASWHSFYYHIYIYFHSVSRFFESEFRLRLPMTAIRFIGESVALGFVSAATATVRADERNPVLLIL